MVSLQADKQHQVIRLINATDAKVYYEITSEDIPHGSKLTVDPSEGFICSRSFVLINITNLGYNDKPNKQIKLKLSYKRRGLSKYEASQVKGIVRLNMKPGTNGAAISSVKEKTFIYRLIRVLRAIFLFVLITYNIILIKYELSR